MYWDILSHYGCESNAENNFFGASIFSFWVTGIHWFCVTFLYTFSSEKNPGWMKICTLAAMKLLNSNIYVSNNFISLRKDSTSTQS